MSLIHIRPARMAELDRLAAIGLAAWQRGIAPLVPGLVWDRVRAANPFRPFLRHRRDAVVVAEMAGEPAGIAARDDGSDYISDLWVSPLHEGQGVGSALLQSLEEAIAAIRANPYFPQPERTIAGLQAKIALRDARAMRSLCGDDWYRARWPGVEFPRDDSASTATALFANTRGGFRKSDTIRGQWTGEHGDDVIVDDPLDPQGAAGSTELDAVLEWWCGTMPTRFRSHATSTRTLIMQRLHEADLTREFIRAGATVLCLPMRFERAHPHRWARDPRTAEGELLCPVRIDEAATKRMEDILGPARAAAQLQQRPSPAGGAVFKAEWFRWWTELPAGGVWSIDVDATFKATDDGSYVVIQVWCDDGARHYLVDQIRRRMGFADTVAAIRAARAQWPKVRTVRIEDKANGPAIIEALRDEMTGVVAVSPEGGKEARANAVQGIVAGGGVYLPDEQHAKYDDGRRGAPWVASFIHEAVTFPKGESDDQVDAMTQHLNASAGSFAARLKSAFGKGAEKK